MNPDNPTNQSSVAKTVIWPVILLLVVGGLIWYGSRKSEEPSVIKIGVIASLTGTGAVRGESAQQGLTLAREEIERSGVLKGRKIELVYEDVPLTEPKKAPAALQKLATIDKVAAVIGPMGSTVVMSVAPLADSVGVPLIVHTASVLKATEDNESLFRLWPTARNYVDVIAPEVTKRGYKKIAVLSATQENTIDFLNIFREAVPALGASIVISEQVTADVKDFRTQLAKIKVAEPDAIFLNLFEGQIGVAADQARKLGITTPFFTNSVMSAVELSVNPLALEGAWFPRFSGYTDEAKQEFISRFGKEPANPETAAAAHDALIALGEVIGKVGTNPEKVKRALSEIEFTGSIGTFSFDENGEAELQVSLRTIRSGEIIDLK
ncbi:MAG: ABC transporter substrate-binding protein [Patescibacteria group bacterium]